MCLLCVVIDPCTGFKEGCARKGKKKHIEFLKTGMILCYGSSVGLLCVAVLCQCQHQVIVLLHSPSDMDVSPRWSTVCIKHSIAARPAKHRQSGAMKQHQVMAMPRSTGA